MTDKTFSDLGVADDLVAGLALKNITSPFPIQELTLPLALQGADLIGQARTGSGKTLAFGLPLLQRVDLDSPDVQAMVVVPTRELCLQVTDDLEVAGRERGVRVMAVYGGVPIEPQTEQLRAGKAHIVVGTPGRLLDHVSRGNLNLRTCTALVLDEADEMLDMGFLPDVERLIEKTADNRQTLLFSATMPAAVVALARRYMSHPTFMRGEVEEQRVPTGITQHFLLVHKLDKPRILARILQTPNRGGVFVFSRTKHMCDRLVEDLRELNVESIAVHGDLRQVQRERNLDLFRDNKVSVLVATEVAARGLDVDNVTHVINYDCPEDEKMYLHRVGRTGRAGADGVAITFATFNEVDRLKMIRKAIDLPDADVHEVFSTSELLTELFDLPEDKPWDRMVKASIASGGRGGNGRPSSSSSSGDRSKGGRDGDRNKGGRDGGRGGRGGSQDRPKRDRTDGEGTERPKRDDSDRPKRERTPRSEAKPEAKPETKTKTKAETVAAPRERTRTRSREVAAASPAPASTSTRGSRNERADAPEAPAAPRKRARAARSDGDDAAPAARSRNESKNESRNESKSESKSENRNESPNEGSSDKPREGGGSGRSRGGRGRSEGGRSSGRDRDGGRGSRGGSGNREGGRDGAKDGGRDNSRDNSRENVSRDAGNDVRDAVTSEVPTAPGPEARGGGKPLHSRTVRVDHLP